MRRHAKAATLGSAVGKHWIGLKRQPRPGIVLTVALALALVALPAAPAAAGTAGQRPLLFSFDGSSVPGGCFCVGPLAIDEAGGDLYVLDQSNYSIRKFNLNGEPQDFTATGTSSVEPNSFLAPLGGIAVDSSSVNPGRIYVIGTFGFGLRAFSPAGAELWEAAESHGLCGGVAVDAQGHPWIQPEQETAEEFASSGAPPAKIGTAHTEPSACRIAIDATGDIFTDAYEGPVVKHEGNLATTIDPEASVGVAVDRTSANGHIFTLHTDSFSEFTAAGAEVGSFGSSLRNGGAIAYDKALDRVYVADFETATISVFGPVTATTVPDAALDPVSPIGVSRATLSGEVNPQGLPTSYFFQWKQGEGPGWAGAERSPTQSIEPPDSTDHAVAKALTGLTGNTTYQVRLVAIDTEHHVRVFSNVATFKTTQAASAPIVSIDPPSAVTDSSALISGTVNPREDAKAIWDLQLSEGPGCSGPFSDRPVHSPSSEADAPVDVSEELTGLFPEQHYCVRITASNSAGTSTSVTKEFETSAVPLTDARTAFVAPRRDTSVRLNGRVNPNGTQVTYHFEYSADGGSSWIALPDRLNASRARKQIVVSQELGGLQPATTYFYRFVAENGAGAPPPGSSKEFETRSRSEVTEQTSCPNEAVRTAQHATYLGECRGIELVNNPDKGTQNVRTNVPMIGTPPMTADGSKAIWTVLGGAPGGTTGTSASFIAERDATGWRNQGLIPPASEQAGGGGYTYQLEAATPSFSKFVFLAGSSSFGVTTTPSIVRLGGPAQEVLASYPNVSVSTGSAGMGIGVTDDGAHVLVRNPETSELEDVGDGGAELISRMPDGTPSSCGVSETGESFVGVSGAGTAAALSWRPTYTRFTARDASRVYFEVRPNGECGNAPYGLYVRDRDAATTTLIDPGVESPTNDVRMIRATPDGRHIYSTTASALDSSDGNGDYDIYRWDESSGTSTCLTCVAADADIRGPVMISDDFSHIYFQSTKQLVAGEGTEGDANIYVLSDGVIRFVAGLPDTSEYTGELGVGIFTASVDAEMSADGNVLLLRAQPSPSLTDDSGPAECPSAAGGSMIPCKQLYRYDDRDTSLECISCPPGASATGVVESATSAKFTGVNLSSDGNTIAFVTSTALMGRDVNGSSDVYEWRNGVLHLLTDGRSAFPNSTFGSPAVRSVSANGNDILFSVVDPTLTGFEQDGLANLYDARVGGGFIPPAPQAHCSEESCQGPLRAAPTVDSPASAAIVGAGEKPTRSRKRKARCARKRGAAKRRCARAHKRRNGARMAKTHARTGGAR